jgi:hypothetical protein
MAFADYTGLIGKGIGTVIGAWFGGPAGAAVGGMAGQMEGDKFGGVLKGDSDWTSMLSPSDPSAMLGGGQQQPAQPQGPANPLIDLSLNQPGPNINFDSYGGATSEVPSRFGSLNLGLGGQPGNATGDPMGNLFTNPSNQFDVMADSPAPPANYSPNFTPTAAPSVADAAAPSGGGFNWGGLGQALQGVGNVLGATGAGLNGDPYYNMRLQQQVQDAAHQKQVMSLEQQKLQLEKANGFRSMLDLAATVNSSNISDEDKKAFAPQFTKLMNDTTGINVSPEFGISLLTGKGKAERLAAAYPDLANAFASPSDAAAFIDKINKNPGQEEQILNGKFYELAINKVQSGQDVPDTVAAHLNEKQKANLGDSVFNKLMGNANRLTPEERSQVTSKGLLTTPNGKFLTDEHFTRLKEAGFPNVEAASVLKSKAIAEPARAQSEQHFQQSQAATRANEAANRAQSESHFQQSKAQSESHFQQNKAQQEANAAPITETVTPVSKSQMEGAASVLNSVMDTPDFKKASDTVKQQKLEGALKAQGLKFAPGTDMKAISKKWLGGIDPSSLPVVKIPAVGKGRGMPTGGTPGQPSINDLINQYTQGK